MSPINKLRISWFVFAIIAAILGYFCLLHGGVYGESAERNNESTLIYQLEVYLGLILLWPVTVYGWVRSALGASNILGLESCFFHMLGYFLLYKLHLIIKLKNT